jgi:hypothetical protein
MVTEVIERGMFKTYITIIIIGKLYMESYRALPANIPKMDFLLVHFARQENQALIRVRSHAVFQVLALKQDGQNALVASQENIPPLAQRVWIVPRVIIRPHSWPPAFPRVLFAL